MAKKEKIYLTMPLSYWLLVASIGKARKARKKREKKEKKM